MQEKEENNTKTIHRLSEYITNTGTSFNKLALELGLSNSYFSKMIKNGGSVGSDIIENILRIHPDLNANWLLTGEGSMFRDSKKSEETKWTGTPVATPISPAEESIIYKMYKDEKEEKERMLKEKDAENKKLHSEIRVMEKELATLKTKYEQYESQPEESLNHPTGLGDAKNVSIKKPSSRHGSNAGSLGVPSGDI